MTSTSEGAAAAAVAATAPAAGSGSDSSRDVWISVEGSRQLSSDADAGAKIPAVGSGEVYQSTMLQETILDRIPDNRRVAVRFKGVNGWVPSGLGPGGPGESLGKKAWRKMISVRGKKEEGSSGSDSQAPAPLGKRQILHNICGGVSPGEVLALMGPSGSGKTSFISVLGGRKPAAMEAEGEMLFNGKPLDKAMKRRVGFVLQDDLMFETLTVEETLYYAAMLRLPKSMTREEKKSRVETVIASLGIEKCRGTLIGGFMVRGVSGGERKRVSVGHELLIDPAFILLDEPTSGLDATTAMHLMTTLRQLAEGGRAVLTTIHQPSSRLYRQLDNVLLLSEGHIMYYGSGKLAIEWFKHVGCSCPYGVNIADYMLDLANGEMDAEGRKDDAMKDQIVARYEHFGISHKEGLQSLAELEQEGADEAQVLPEDVGGRRSMQLQMDVSGTKGDRWGATYWGQVTILFERCIKIRRSESLGLQQYLRLLLTAIIAAGLWWQVGGEATLKSASDTVGLLFFEQLFVSLMALFASVFTFPADFNMMLKERSSGMYRLSTYYIARTAADLPMDLTIPSLFVFVIYWSTGLRISAGAFFGNWLGVMLLTLVGQSVGMLIGASVMDVQKAQTVATVLMLGLMLVGGFFVREVPSWIDWLKYGSFIWWGFSLLNKIEFGGRSFVDCGDLGVAEVDGCVPVDDLQDALNLPTDVDKSVWPELVFLFASLVIMRWMIYEVLRRKTMA
eukprot:evm.model.scf_2037.2 EVM.evm.TU.scf_2037.2   scf_2037:9622-19005(-)